MLVVITNALSLGFSSNIYIVFFFSFILTIKNCI